MAKYYCRCSRKKCQARVTLSKHPEDYVRPPKCKMCGGRKFRVDRWRGKNERGVACRCQGTHYPHRHKSIVCLDHPWYGKSASEIEEIRSLEEFHKFKTEKGR